MRRGTNVISRKQSAAALANLLYGCTPERLASFTGAELAGSYGVSEAKAEEMLAAARQGRLV